ncbi:unnamed protein product [Cladocopium goreaui]|uniref:Uncharacterized protein n=1 Tax=Cladocopium goreaui TaxID=2562237 RepID=A0A9P1BMN0_9DINO|nr:unnamed protein product [Cladocopium goreaui]
MAKGSEFESVQKYLEEVKYERLCVSCWAQVLIDRLLLDELSSARLLMVSKDCRCEQLSIAAKEEDRKRQLGLR